MPHPDWQLIVALLAIAGAAWFLIRRGTKRLRNAGKASDGACGACDSCHGARNSGGDFATGFVLLESLSEAQSAPSPQRQLLEQDAQPSPAFGRNKNEKED